MKKINRFTTLMCLLFAVSACGGKEEYYEDLTEEYENEGFVGEDPKDTTPLTPSTKPDPKPNPIFDTDSGKTFKNLCSLANKQLISAKSLSASNEYVSGLVSLEYANNKVAFCALGDKQDNTNYLVKVTMNATFTSADDFISKMVSLDLASAATTYSVTSEIMSIYGEPQVNNKFHELKASAIEHFDETKFNSQCCYRADNSETNYFAFTYVGTDSKVYSSNEMILNMENNNLTFTSKYEVNSSDSEKMYTLFNIILENY